MSTYINVTVDGGGLSERAKAQTNANRQAKLEGDNRQKVEAQGRDQRDATRAQQGIGPDGLPLYGTPARSTLRRDEPAALWTNLQGLNLGHAWVFRSEDERHNLATYAPVQGYKYRWLDAAASSPFRSNVYIGCGNASQWITESCGPEQNPFQLQQKQAGYDGAIVSDYTQVAYVPGTSDVYATSEYFIGSRPSKEEFARNYHAYMALPAGRGVFILVSMKAWSYYTDVKLVSTFYIKDTSYYDSQNNLLPEPLVTYIPADQPTTTYGWRVAPGAPGPLPQNLNLGRGWILDRQVESNAQAEIHYYLCTNNSMREIVPAPGSGLEQLFSSLYTDDNTYTNNTTPAWPNNIPKEFMYASLAYIGEGPYSEGGDGYEALYDYTHTVYTPYVFRYLWEDMSYNGLTPFAEESAVKQGLPSKKSWGIDDPEGSVYGSVPQPGPDYGPWPERAYAVGGPFRHALVKAKGQDPSLEYISQYFASELAFSDFAKRMPQADLNLSADRPARTGTYQSQSFVTVWDWDDPAYCRQMCLALGFTEADLTP